MMISTRNRLSQKQQREIGQRLNLVYHKGKYRLYDSASQALHAANQLGDDAIAVTTYVSGHDMRLIEVEEMKRSKKFWRKYNQAKQG